MAPIKTFCPTATSPRLPPNKKAVTKAPESVGNAMRPKGLRVIKTPPKIKRNFSPKAEMILLARAELMIATNDVKAKKSEPSLDEVEVFSNSMGKKGPLALSIHPKAKRDKQATET